LGITKNREVGRYCRYRVRPTRGGRRVHKLALLRDDGFTTDSPIPRRKKRPAQSFRTERTISLRHSKRYHTYDRFPAAARFSRPAAYYGYSGNLVAWKGENRKDKDGNNMKK